MILDLVYYPDPLLRKRCAPIEEIDEEVCNLAKDMIETMYHHRGVGLAAPQVGVLKRICVIDISEEKNSPLVLINPEITERKGSVLSHEGCLSFPGIYGNVERAESVSVTYTDLEGNTQRIEKESSFLSIVLQHEIDHLDGILFIQLMTPTERAKIRRELKELERKFKKRAQV